MSSNDKSKVPVTDRESLDASTQELLSFKVAQEAKKQVMSWAKWFLGLGLAILAVLGLRAYSDFQSKIDGIDQKVEIKVEKVLTEKQKKIDELTANMLDHYVQSLVETQSQSKATIDDSKQAAQKVETETEHVMDLLNEYKGLIEKYKNEAEVTRENLLALSQRSGPVLHGESGDGEVAVFGKLTDRTLGISAARDDMVAYDYKTEAVFLSYFTPALSDAKSDTNGDGSISIQEAFDIATGSIGKKFPMKPVLNGEDRSFAFVKVPYGSEYQPSVRVRALLIGINSYESTPLRSCVNDVNRFRGFLKSHTLNTDETVRLLTDNMATKANIDNGLQWLGETAQPTECLIFFFSGMLGRTPNQQGQTSAVVYSVDKKELQIPQIAQTLQKVTATQKLIILD
jgi:hypothetical protein